MRAKQITLFLIMMLLLAACGNTKAVKPTETAVDPATAEPAESEESVEGIPTPTIVDDASGAIIYIYDL